MPEWIMGVIGVAAIPAVVFIWKTFQVRAKVVASGVRLGKLGRGFWMGYDIPIIGGKIESSIKERVVTTFGDFVWGLYCGLTGKNPNKR